MKSIDEKVPVNFRFPRGLKDEAEHAASGLGMNLSDFVRGCTEIFSEMNDHELWASLLTLSATHNLPRGVVLRNMLATYHGIKWAQREVYGPDDPQIQIEWGRTQDGATLSAKAICEEVKDEYVRIFKTFRDSRKNKVQKK